MAADEDGLIGAPLAREEVPPSVIARRIIERIRVVMAFPLPPPSRPPLAATGSLLRQAPPTSLGFRGCRGPASRPAVLEGGSVAVGVGATRDDDRAALGTTDGSERR